MNNLQEQIFKDTEKLVGTFSLMKVVVYTIISTGIILLLLLVLSFPIDLYTGGFVLGISLIYSFVRDFFMTRYSKKMMYSYYNYLKEKKPRISLYIPMFQKTRQGFFLKKASLYFDNTDLFMEAFNQQKSRSRPEDSISIKQGADLSLDRNFPEYKNRIVTFQGRLMDNDYQFSIVNIKEVLDMIVNSKGAKS